MGVAGEVGDRVRARLERVPVAIRSAFELVVRDAVRNLGRNRRTHGPALGSMVVLLLLAGLGGIGGLAVRDVVQREAQQAAILHIYLKDTATGTQVMDLEGRLAGDRRVARVTYESKAQALAEVRRRPGLGALVAESGDNPLPASLVVQVRSLDQVAPVAGAVADDAAVDPSHPSSYDAEVYAGLQTFVRVAGLAVLGLLMMLGLVSALVTANAIRAGIVARWDELQIKRLVGASGWMLRAPFVIEGGLVGLAAGLLGAVLLIAIYTAALRASAGAFTDVLPGVGWASAAACAAVLPALGWLLGSTSSLLGLRGVPR